MRPGVGRRTHPYTVQVRHLWFGRVVPLSGNMILQPLFVSDGSARNVPFHEGGESGPTPQNRFPEQAVQSFVQLPGTQKVV